ncbi:hypothetical protein SLEP1_g10754 [Rubroshorea leprosula]|uniref:Uncharacterized protein n=1 Tax=Rubroshorea leprosula TaxID=152421 RepID=A0AAV5IID6_9ROSI|nr:hypothetical protein SLEP1_g10754 [Rubroshorea leprosula]
MLEELERLSALPDPSRIRLFLFPVKPCPMVCTESNLSESEQPIMHRREGNEGVLGLVLAGAELTRTELSQVQSSRSELNHPKTESWFVDALRTAKIVQKGENGVAGFGAEGGGSGQGEGNSLCGQESIVLETSSSFGSTSSTVSFSNLPPVKGPGEENGLQFQDCKPKLPLPESIASDSISNATSYMSCAQTGTSHQESVVPIAAMESKISANPYESDSKIPDLPFGIHLHPSVQFCGYAANPQLNLPQQQNVQIVHASSHYGPQNPTGVLPMTSYIPVYHPVIQQQQSHYQSNQPCPLYYLPVPQSQQYNYPVQCGLVHSSFASAQPQMHSNAPGIPPQLVLKEVGVTPPPVPELTSQAHRNVPTANQIVHVSYRKTEQDPIPSQIHHQPQSFAVASGESTNYNNEPDDDPARILIYKSQPPPPTSPSHYQTMNKVPTALLSEPLAQLHTNDVKQQIRTLEP